jgi:N-acetylmuramoyl-L-alanine amidase
MRRIYSLFLLIFTIVLLSACSTDKVNNKLDSVETLGEDNSDVSKFEDIEEFLNRIASADLAAIDKFYLYGSEAGYEKVATSSLGYIPFYKNSDLDIIDEIVPMSNTYIRPGRDRSKTKYIVIHNTGMANPVMTAKRLSSSINNSTRQASWHFTIDDFETYQQLNIDEIGWHAGSSEGNNYGVGIEMAVYDGIDFNQALRRTAKLTASLLLKYDLGIKDVVQHYDFTGKNCPQVIREAGRWEEFLELVEIEYYGMSYLSDVIFKYTTLSSGSLSNDGKVLKKLQAGQVVEWVVEASYNGFSKSFKLSKTI